MPEEAQAAASAAVDQASDTDHSASDAASGTSASTSSKAAGATGAAAKVDDLPEWAQKEIRDLRKEAADRRKAATDAENAAKANEEQNLAQQQKWQELAEKRRGELDALKSKVETADKLTEMVTVQYTTEIKAWPEQVRAMAPSDDASILTKLEWMTKAKPLALELMGDKDPTPGNGRKPSPVSPAGTGATAEKAKGEHRKFTTNNF